MSNKNNDPFENMRKIQRMIDMVNFPMSQYQKQLSILDSLNFSPLADTALAASNAVSTITDTLLKQQKFFRSITNIVPNNIDFNAFYTAMNSVAASPIVDYAPKELARLSETIAQLISGIDFIVPPIEEGTSDMNASLVVKENVPDPLVELSWVNVLKLLAWLIPILITYQIAAGDDAQHKEQMKLLEENLHLQEEQLDLMRVEIKNQETVNAALFELLEQMNDALHDDEQSNTKANE